VDWPPLPEMSYYEYEAADDSDDLSDLGSAEGKPPISLKQTEFSLKQFPKGWGRPTTVLSSSGRKYGRRVFWRTSIGPVSGGRTV